MLSLTETAAQAVRDLAASSGLGPDPGVRIATGPPSPSGVPLEISLTGGPQPDDQTVEDGGATVYVEEEVSLFLDDKVLDAAVADGTVRFRLQDS
jgi:Fe-S cluster assembly iron-binding protein IscA